jgi:hypothetical protein
MADTSITSNVQDGAGIVSNIVSGVSVTGQIATGAKGDKGDKGDTGTTDHLLLTNIGTNTHAQIDTAITASTSHIANTSNPHSVTKAQVGLSNVPNTDFTAAVAANTAKLTADTANVTAAGALMDSEVTNLAQVKAFSSSDYATSAQGTASSSHIANTSNPHSVTKTQVGLGNADNTSDADKPVSTAQQTALNLKANQSTTYTKTEVDGLNTAHLAALDPHPQYLNDIEGDTRYANSPYAVMAKSQFANLATSYGLLGQTYGNSGYGNDFTVYGNSTQASTPTPDVPVSITSTTGNVTVRSNGKNMIVMDRTTPVTTGGVTYTPNANGTITINGTASANTTFNTETSNTSYIRLIAGQVYGLSGAAGGDPATQYFVQMQITNDDGTTTYITATSANTYTFTAAKSGWGRPYVGVRTGYVANNVVLSPQFELSSTVTAFERSYNSLQTLPLATTQLRSLPNGVSDRIYKSGGTWYMEQNVGELTADGSETTWTTTVSTGSPTYTYTYTSAYDSLLSTIGSIGDISLNNRFSSTKYLHTAVSVSVDTLHIGSSDNPKLRMFILSSRLSASTQAGVKAWLAANPVTINYLRATPITTAITDPATITALESIRTYQGITNITAGTPVSGSYGLDLTTALAGKVDKVSSAGTSRLYAISGTGSQVTETYTATSSNWSIAQRDGSGKMVSNGILATTNLASDVGSAALYYSNLFARRQYLNSTAYFDGSTAGRIATTGLFMPVQATTAGAPAYVKGAMYFDTTLNKLRIGGATAWETVTST